MNEQFYLINFQSWCSNEIVTENAQLSSSP